MERHLDHSTNTLIAQTALLQQRVAELEDRLARCEALLAQLPDGAVLLFDHALRYTLAAGAALAPMGLSKASLEGKSVREALPPEHWEAIERRYRDALDGQPTLEEARYGERVFEMRTQPLYSPDGQLLGGMVLAADITARKAAEAALQDCFQDISLRKRAEQAAREQTELFQMVIDQMSDGVVVADLDGRFQIFNRASQHLFGPSVDTSTAEWSARYGLFLSDQQTVFPPEELPLVRALHGEERRGVEVFVRHAQAPEGLWVSVNGRPIYGADGQIRGGLVVCRDETERKRSLAEREELHKEIIRMQSAALRELSTPLIPINDQVVVMPLVGSVDSQRAEQVIETLLGGVARSRARVAILDITGVPVVDALVANALLRIARSARLLGTHVVLTGIRPEVAQTLVGLEVGLDGIITRGTLQSGIAYAMGSA